ncbi:MAG TPA: hypothetical protein VHZ76_03885 [Gammaproteobacteria bacterium]|jgi:hypothetical protein|nr:hypothetical protein [Gammaproteobacteria bacterium]
MLHIIKIIGILFFCCLIPTTYATSYSGQIEKNVYYNQISDKHGYGGFKVEIPQINAGESLRNIDIKDEKNPYETSASFGQSDKDFSYYRLSITVPTTASFDKKIIDQLFKIVEQKAVTAFAGEMKLITNKNPKKNTFYRVYTQKSPGVPIGSSPGKIYTIEDAQIYTHAVHITFYQGRYILRWCQATDLNLGNRNVVNDKNRQQMINRKWAPCERFGKSLAVAD